MILVSKDYAQAITHLPPAEQPALPYAINSDKVNKQGKLELTIVRIKPKRLPRGYSCVIVVCVYIPNWGPTLQNSSIGQLIQAIAPVITNNTSSDHPLIYICGDFNGANTSPVSRALTVHQLQSGTTRLDRTLDIILTNSPNSYQTTIRSPIGRSDHSTVEASSSSTQYKQLLAAKSKILVRTGRIEDTVAEIDMIRWSALMPADFTNNGQECFDVFYSAVLACQDHHQPLKTAKTRNDKPWMTAEIKELIHKRQKLWYTGPSEEWKQVSALIKSKIKIRKKFFNSRYTNGDVNWWKEVKATAKPKTDIDNSQESANQINDGFYGVWADNKQPDISSFITDSKDAPPIFTHRNVSETVGRLKKSAPGPDELSGVLLKAANKQITNILVILFNLCLLHSFVPSQWKSANITPIPKVPHPQTPMDYRPISLTSTLCKVFERILAQYIIAHTKHLWKNNSQYGFLPGRSTMDAIIQVIESWSQAKDIKQDVLAIFFDFAKAFDLVNHQKLLVKLQKILPSWLVSWIAAYLQTRRQRVCIGKMQTEWKQVEAGVIQGSVLGPILFVLFILDINDYLPPGVEILKYADDILAYITGTSSKGDLPQKVVDGIEKWCKDNDMRLNISKCKVMQISSNSDPNFPTLTISNQALEAVPSYKYLGIDINRETNWGKQWQSVQRKIASIPYLLKRLKYLGFRKEILVTVYKSNALSHFVYSAPLLTSCNAKEKAEMASFQRRALKIINVDTATAKEKYSIIEVSDFIDHHCTNILSRILKDPEHPLTLKTTKANERSKFKFIVAKAKHSPYVNSFVQKHLRALRDGSTHLYTTGAVNRMPKRKTESATTSIGRPSSPKQQKKSPSDIKPVNAKPTIECSICGKSYKAGAGIATHKRLRHSNSAKAKAKPPKS